MIHNVFDYLNNSVSKYPEKIAFVQGERQVTYREFYESCLNASRWIMNHQPMKHKPILVKMANSIDTIIAFFAVALSGNIYVPVAFDMPEERLEVIINKVLPELVINTTHLETKDDEYSIKELMESAHSNDIECISDEICSCDPLYILFTSGSTGIPKGVTISHGAVIDFTEEASEKMNFSENEIFLNQAPFYFDASVPDIFCTIRNGATLHIIDRKMFSFPVRIADYIEKNKINAIFWVPSALITMAKLKALNSIKLASLKKIMFCGEIMPVKQLNMWKKAVPNAVYVNYYGPSETTYASTYYIVDRDFREDENLPIGKHAINTRIILVDDKGKQVKEVGVIGEIFIGGRGISLGYYNDTDRTNEVFVQNPFQNKFREIFYKTGDLAHYEADGNLYYDGRRDYQVKHMGYRIELNDIESVASSIDSVVQVVCVYSHKKDKIVIYYSGNITSREIINKLATKLPTYMLPNVAIQLENFPLNQNGKIDRKLLLKDYEQIA